MTDSPLKTPLHDAHVAFGARMVEFAGWSMPLVYTSIIEEHNHTRNSCSLFDVSHMGRLRIEGRDAEAFLNRLCTRNLAGADVGRSYYSHVCREDGGVLDDVIVSRYEDHWLMVCNASNRAKIVAWLGQHAQGLDVTIADQTSSTAMIALQGPNTMELAAELVPVDLSTLKRYRFTTVDFLGMPFSLFRSGYTGEDGLEVICPASAVRMLLPALVGNKAKPREDIRFAGLGARDTLRIEAAMPLYGHELSEEVDSLTAGQGWCVDLSKDFIGAEPMRLLKEVGLKRKMVGLELDGRRIGRKGHKVCAGKSIVGEVTSGTMSPTLGESIAMGFVASEYAAEGTALRIDLGGKQRRAQCGARVVKLPFYQRSRRVTRASEPPVAPQ